MSLNEDEKFFADLIKDEFGCNTCIEEIKNKDFPCLFFIYFFNFFNANFAAFCSASFLVEP